MKMCFLSKHTDKTRKGNDSNEEMIHPAVWFLENYEDLENLDQNENTEEPENPEPMNPDDERSENGGEEREENRREDNTENPQENQEPQGNQENLEQTDNRNDGPRKSQRQGKEKKCMRRIGCRAAKCDISSELLKDPTTVSEALDCFYSVKWEGAIQTEIERLLDMDTWKIVPRPKNQKVIDCKWIFKRKYNELGEVLVHKARLVAR